MKNQFLEAGQIVNTHGIQGEVKIVPWCDSPEFFCGFHTVYIDAKPIKLLRATPHHSNVIARLEGVDDVNAAMRLKGKTLSVDRTGLTLPDGRHFLADLMGLEVRNAETGQVIGVLDDVFTTPAHDVYQVKGAHTYLIPAVDAFIIESNPEGGYIRVKLIEGMESDV